jgi:hypothetical protein
LRRHIERDGSLVYFDESIGARNDEEQPRSFGFRQDATQSKNDGSFILLYNLEPKKGLGSMQSRCLLCTTITHLEAEPERDGKEQDDEEPGQAQQEVAAASVATRCRVNLGLRPCGMGLKTYYIVISEMIA